MLQENTPSFELSSPAVFQVESLLAEVKGLQEDIKKRLFDAKTATFSCRQEVDHLLGFAGGGGEILIQ